MRAVRQKEPVVELHRDSKNIPFVAATTEALPFGWEVKEQSWGLLCRWPGGHSVLVGDAVHDGQTVKIEKGRIVE